MHIRSFLLAVAVCLLSSVAQAQNLVLPLNHDLYDRYDAFLNRKDMEFHTGFKPYLLYKVHQYANPDSVINAELKTATFIERRKHPKPWRSILHDHALKIEKEDYLLALDPFIDFSAGYDFEAGKALTVNTRGLMASGNLGRRVSFMTGFTENQTRYPRYLENYIIADTVVPGQGAARNFKGKAVDYANAFGYLSITVNKFFNIQGGHGKHFIGDGYRSLLLSDFSYYYPYLKLTTTVWKLQYVNLWAQFIDRKHRASYSRGFRKKFASLHYLSYVIHPRIEVGLFEAIVWESEDSTGRRGFDVNYLNPIILYRPIQLNLGSPDNGLLGLNIKLKIFDYTHTYFQLLLDDLKFSELKKFNGFYQQKVGIQFGFKTYRLFKVENLFFQAELNNVRPYTYAHKYPGQNYAHYSEPLAHPLGANFRELVTIMKYRYWRIYGALKVIYAMYGMDLNGLHAGNDIFVSDFKIPNFPRSYNNTTGQGVKANLLFTEFRMGFLVNPKLNGVIEFSLYTRNWKSQGTSQDELWFTLGLKTNLQNLYYDF